MPYSSSLTDAEWEILEPLLADILPQKKRTRPSNAGEARNLRVASSINSKMVVIGKICPSTCRPTPRSTGTCIQWREAGAIEKLMTVLHGQVREGVKKTPNGQRPSSSTRKRCKILVMQASSQKGSASTKQQMELNGIWQLIH